MGKMDKLFQKIESGKFIFVFQFSTAIIILIYILVSGISTGNDQYVSNKETGTKRYIIRKVSSIPEKVKDDQSDTAIESIDVLSYEDIKSRYVNYVISRIERNKNYPDRAREREQEGSVNCRIKIEKNGGLVDVSVLSATGYSLLENASLRAINRSAPFLPFPEQMKELSIVLNIKMDYYLE